MYSYIIAKIVSINKKTITIEANNIAYTIYVANPTKFQLDRIQKIYLFKFIGFNNKNNIFEEFYGFDQFDQKELFYHLITINGIGPKTAITICKNDVKIIKKLIFNKKIEDLVCLEGINTKIAKLMVDNLADFNFINGNEKTLMNENNNLSELIQTLKSLGYQKNEIDKAINMIDISDKTIELSDLVANAIKIIACEGQNNVKHSKTV